jgi:outer membrane immunogenic protein
MRRLSVALIAAVSAIALTQVALAGDLPTKAPVAPIAVAPSWTGFYIGANAGGSWMNASAYTFADPGNAAFASCGPCTVPYQPEVLSSHHNNSGVIGGIHLGYNWQFAPAWLVGVEGDFSGTSISQRVNAPLFSNAGPGPGNTPVVGSNLNFETDVKWLATLRGRLGWNIQPDWLVYATGGVAWAQFDRSANASCPPPALANGCVFTSGTTAPFNLSTTRTGFVVGGGVEWQMASHWRSRLEYLYYGFDSTDSGSSLFTAIPGGGPLPCINTPTCSANYTLGNVNIQTVRIGLSYAFR